MIKSIFTLAIIMGYGLLHGQLPAGLEFDLYGEAYYAQYNDSLGPNAFQQHTTSAPRSDRIGLNHIQLGINLDRQYYRSALTLHYGDIAQATWDPTFTVLQEANVGISLNPNSSKSARWWIDAGFFRTHIGMESFLPRDNFLTSTAVATYYGPFYQAGARLQYSIPDTFTAEIWVLNGYNRFLDNNDAKSVGLLLSYNPRPGMTIAYTNLVGDEAPAGSARRQIRFYQNAYIKAQFGPSDKWEVNAGADFGWQTNSQVNDPTAMASMWNAVLTLRRQFGQFAAIGRGELYHDPDGMISGIPQRGDPDGRGVELWGATLGAEYRPVEDAWLRIEGRYLRNSFGQFTYLRNGTFEQGRMEILLALGIRFKHFARQ